AWLANASADPRALTYVIGGEQIILKKNGEAFEPKFSLSAARAFGHSTETVFLGTVNGTARFGLGIDPAAIAPLKERGELFIIDLRSIAMQGIVSADDLPPLAEAKALLNWHARHRFCPNCGATTHVVHAGWKRECPSCKAEHFPRTDPVVIMLAID